MKLLLHMCCGPCSIYPVSVFQEEGIDFSGLYYNPNIHPLDEYNRRMENVGILAERAGFDVHYEDGFMQQQWEEFPGTEPERCNMCYTLRMNKAAQLAAKGGFTAFTTSLLISPYQKHDLIRQIGQAAAKRNGIEFYYRDFRPQFRLGQQMAKDAGLYRQKYCGCILSKPQGKATSK